ncbi:hypothetical protein BpHYR1_019226 [Brachionus plicatilis]|uniref:Uncharacterized protein n=1 Tax=Brachionus plicatilis TaxID=10195 RepID=A0A3M7QHT7_BRAPC|nr:hypothetical protein BpHYR1_019226 [Brachionus plicatilis]
MIEEIVEINLEENKERFLVLLFNCIYYNCDLDKSWSLIARKIVFNQETQNKEFCYLVQIKLCCHDLSLLTLWVNQSYLTNSKTRHLIEKFEKNLLRNNLRGSREPNIEESIEYCDTIIDELFTDSNKINVAYEDYEWLMRKYDPGHEYFNQKENLSFKSNNLGFIFL